MTDERSTGGPSGPPFDFDPLQPMREAMQRAMDPVLAMVRQHEEMMQRIVSCFPKPPTPEQRRGLARHFVDRTEREACRVGNGLKTGDPTVRVIENIIAECLAMRAALDNGEEPPDLVSRIHLAESVLQTHSEYWSLQWVPAGDAIGLYSSRVQPITDDDLTREYVRDRFRKNADRLERRVNGKATEYELSSLLAFIEAEARRLAQEYDATP